MLISTLADMPLGPPPNKAAGSFVFRGHNLILNTWHWSKTNTWLSGFDDHLDCAGSAHLRLNGVMPQPILLRFVSATYNWGGGLNAKASDIHIIPNHGMGQKAKRSQCINAGQENMFSLPFRRMFPSSTQFKHWTFTGSAELGKYKRDANVKFINEHGKDVPVSHLESTKSRAFFGIKSDQRYFYLVMVEIDFFSLLVASEEHLSTAAQN